MNQPLDQIKREAAAINRTLREFNVDAGVPAAGGHIVVAGYSFVLYQIRRGNGVRIAAVEKLLPELTDALRAVRRDDQLLVRMRDGRTILEVPHPTPQPLMLTKSELALADNQMLVARSWSESGAHRETVTLDSAFGHIGVFAQTRGGKSTLLRTMIGSLALNTSPDDCRMVLVDAKREDFDPFSSLPHVQAYAWRRDAMGQAIRWAHGEMVRRIERKSDSRQALIVAVDEVAKLLDDVPEIEDELKQLAGQGAGTNVHLILATQHPTSKSLGKGDGSLIKANLTLRLVGSVADSGAAQLSTGRGGSGAHLLPARSGAFLWVEGQRLARIQTHLVTLDDTRKMAAIARRRWSGKPAGLLEPHIVGAAPAQPSAALAVPARTKAKVLDGLSDLERARAIEVARWLSHQKGLANLGHNEKIRRAYQSGMFTSDTRGGSNSRVIRAADRLIQESI